MLHYCIERALYQRLCFLVCLFWGSGFYFAFFKDLWLLWKAPNFVYELECFWALISTHTHIHYTHTCTRTHILYDLLFGFLAAGVIAGFTCLDRTSHFIILRLLHWEYGIDAKCARMHSLNSSAVDFHTCEVLCFSMTNVLEEHVKVGRDSQKRHFKILEKWELCQTLLSQGIALRDSAGFFL